MAINRGCCSLFRIHQLFTLIRCISFPNIIRVSFPIQQLGLLLLTSILAKYALISGAIGAQRRCILRMKSQIHSMWILSRHIHKVLSNFIEKYTTGRMIWLLKILQLLFKDFQACIFYALFIFLVY